MTSHGVRSTRIRMARQLTAMTVVAATTLVGFPAMAQQTLAARPNDISRDARTADDLFARNVTVNVVRVPLKRAVDAVAASAKVLVQYQADLFDAYPDNVTLQVDDVPLRSALDRLLARTTLHAVPDGTTQLMIVDGRRDAAITQEVGTVIGRIVHAKTKRPIAGARVSLGDTPQTVASDGDGTFRLPTSAGEHTVTVRAVGFVRQARTVTVQSGKTVTVDFSLEPSASVLDEVVVTGTVVATERKAITTPITVITAADIERRGITRLDQLFRGEIPGVVALEQGSGVYSDRNGTLGAMATARVYSRGASTMGQRVSSPLKTYIDGVELLDPSYLGTIDPKSIERIEIITGPQAATVYGSGAMGGVMQIFTKKGSAGAAPDVTLGFKYGMLQSSVSSGLTPSHNDVISITGGRGPDVSYAGNLSYVYTGQWQPELSNRTYGGSAGVTMTAGAFTASGTASMTNGENGTYTEAFSRDPFTRKMRSTGEWRPAGSILAISSALATSASQTLSFSGDYRAATWWQHHVTFGRNQTDFAYTTKRPELKTPSDSLLRRTSSNGHRTTLGYNMTLIAPAISYLSSTMTFGLNGSTGMQRSESGCIPNGQDRFLSACDQWDVVSVTYDRDERSWGGFGSWQVGLFDRLYLTLGVRGERNPAYGKNHTIDWTPTNGIAYTMEYGDLTMKLLASYGRSTRPPGPDAGRDFYISASGFTPNQYLSQVANPNLTPEYSSGPQGGVELYFGNRGSVTLNAYRQTVSDLLMSVQIDSTRLVYDADPTFAYYGTTYVNANVGSVRQYGMEATGSLNLWRLSMRGTWSWNESRIRSIAPGWECCYSVGSQFLGVPVHTANITASYTYGGTSIALVTNIMGKMIEVAGDSDQGALLYHSALQTRIRMYVPRWNYVDGYWPRDGYAKSDLAASQRLTGRVTATLNVTNLGDSYGSDVSVLEPTLGRQTMVGLSIRPFSR